MQQTFTIILDVGGGTYIDHCVGDTLRNALLEWALRPHATVMSVFQVSDEKDFYKAVMASTDEVENLIVPLVGIQSVWFFTLNLNDVEGYINVIKTKID